MRIFGLEINVFKKPEIPVIPPMKVEDQVPEIKVVIPDTKRPALIPHVRSPVLRYHAQKSLGRGFFREGEYNLAEIGRIEDTDSYVRQAFDKKVALMFKEGWDLVGKNPRTIKYIKTRFAQIAKATGSPTQALFRDIGSSLVRKSNSFVIKVRKTEASGGRVRTEPNKTIPIKPIAGYFIAPAETIQYQLSGNKIVKWRQSMPNGDLKEYNPQDVLHIYYDRKEGFAFGTPQLVPVVDDIRALRKIEENIELLVYQHLFPLFQYIVGTEKSPAGINENGVREIDVIKTEIMFMPSEGGIVTPERHEIKAIGAEGRALRAEGYLDHFKKRVFSGLGLSAVDFGEGETANRATADNMSRNLIDLVKDFQQVFEMFINDFIISELLLESTFGDAVLDEDNVVTVVFKEIDVDAQIKKEAHSADLFAKDIIEHDEARQRLGLEPWIIPTPDEVQSETDRPEMFPQWHKSRWKMFDLPKLLIQALDEPWSPQARAAAADSSLPMTEAGNKQSAKEQNEQEINLEKERSKAKIAVAKAKPAPKKKDGLLVQAFVETKKDVVNRVKTKNRLEHDWVSQLIRVSLGTVIDQLISQQILSFRAGYAQHRTVEDPVFVGSLSVVRVRFRDRAEHYINKLANSLVSSLKRNVNNFEPDHIVAETRAVFDALEFRTHFIEDVEIRKAFTFGQLSALRDTGLTTVLIAAKPGTSSIIAQSKDGEPIYLGLMTLDDVPPFHASDTTKFVIPPITDSVIQDEGADEVGEAIPASEFRTCPECGKTAIKTKGTADIYNCKACGHAFQALQADTEEGDKEVENATLSQRKGK